MTISQHLHPNVRARAEREHEQAVAAGRAAVAAAADASGKASPTYAAALLRLAEVFVAFGDLAAAEPLFQECLQRDIETGREAEPSGRETLRRMVAFYRLWDRELEARPLARRLAAIEAAQFGGDQVGTEAPIDEPSLASELVGELGGAGTVRLLPRIWLGLVTPGVLVVLAIMRYSSNRVRIRSRNDFYSFRLPMTVESWPAAIALGTLLLCAATYLHCHYYAGIKHPFGVAYVKFGAICVGIVCLFLYAWGLSIS